LGILAAVAGVLYIAYGLGLWYTESQRWLIGSILYEIGIVASRNAGSYSGLVINAVILAYLYSQRERFEITFYVMDMDLKRAIRPSYSLCM